MNEIFSSWTLTAFVYSNIAILALSIAYIVFEKKPDGGDS